MISNSMFLENFQSYNELCGVSIPVYKRPAELYLCLQSIIRAGGKYRIPIFITDDSADHTNQSVINAIKNIYPFVYHRLNERNLGIDRNILASVDFCRCKFAWILGEDDRMLPDACEKMIQVLEQLDNKVRFVYANYSAVDDEVSMVLREKAIDLNEDMLVKDDIFLSRYAWSIGFIGACVVCKESWTAVARERYAGTYYAHVGTIMEMVKGGSVYMVSDSLILNRCGTAAVFSWADDAFNVLYGWEKLINKLRSQYSQDVCDDAIGSFEQAHGLNSLKLLAYLRADGMYSYDKYRKYIRVRQKGLKSIFALVLAFVPPPLFRVMRYVLHSWRKLVCIRIK